MPRGGGYYKIGNRYRIGSRWYQPKVEPDYAEDGMASWYGKTFHGKKTANGETFDMNRLSAAHPTLPLPSYVAVTNLGNGRTVIVRVNDRGPYARNRIIDVSQKTARILGFADKGVARVRVKYIAKAPLDGSDHREREFLNRQPWYRQTLARLSQ